MISLINIVKRVKMNLNFVNLNALEEVYLEMTKDYWMIAKIIARNKYKHVDQVLLHICNATILISAQIIIT